jgi:hypothetical protein
MEQTTEQAIAEIWKLFKETDAKFKETDAQIKATNAQMKETDAKLRRLEGLFGNQWGKLLEALTQPGILRLFQSRGHQVCRLHQRSKAQRNGDTIEIDLILEDQTEVIAVEVKTALTVEGINEFLSDLVQFTAFFPLYANYRIYGAVAGLDVPDDIARYAYRRGLFLLRISGEDVVQIQNDEKFTPRNFNPAVTASKN